MYDTMTAMDGYKGRKAPNVSQYLANLNALPSAHDMATQQQEDFNIDDDLAQFTNTSFLDFDGDFLEPPLPEYDPSLEEKARSENAAANSKIGGKGLDFVNGMLHIAKYVDYIDSKSLRLNRILNRNQNATSKSMTHR